MSIQALRGMKDLVDTDAKRYEYVIQTCMEIARRYGYEYIETPVLEDTSLFRRSVGESSDIVTKEMYQFFDKGDHDVCLRPEGTAGIVRSYIQNKFDKAKTPKRFYYYGSMFRYERPQKGRLRSFHQFGAESFGYGDVKEDANIIIMIYEMFKALGIKTTLKLNSLGCIECMPTYRDNLVGFLQGISNELCEDCNNRIKTNPIRVLDCKNESCQKQLTDSPKITTNLCENCDGDFSELLRYLDAAKIAYEIDPNLVRGLDYYNKTAFEFISGDIGAQSAIAGGGRYDKLVEYLDGKETYGVGFAMGIERLLELVKLPESQREGYYLASSSKEGIDKLFIKALSIRQDRKAYVEYGEKRLKNALKGADKANARYLGFIGEDELAKKTIWIKDLEKKEEYEVFFEEF